MDPLATPPPTLWASPTFTPRQPARASSNDIKDMSARCGGVQSGSLWASVASPGSRAGLGKRGLPVGGDSAFVSCASGLGL